MERNRFDSFREDFTGKRTETMMSKREEYSPSQDVHQNFKEVAAFLNIRPSEVLMAYLMKHIQAIQKAVQKGVTANDMVWRNEDGSEGLLQRFGDAVNYLELLAGQLIEDTPSR